MTSAFLLDDRSYLAREGPRTRSAQAFRPPITRRKRQRLSQEAYGDANAYLTSRGDGDGEQFLALIEKRQSKSQAYPEG